jgi:PAS domain S-box-containing protein
MKPTPIRVLVVDDEPDLCTLSKEFLETPDKMLVDVAYSVKEARNALGTGSYHVIVSDFQMAGEDGIQFLKSLRSKGNNTPFILFTGKGREEVAIEALNNGADAYLQKGGLPMPMYAELRHRIIDAAGRRRAEEETIQTLSMLESTMESTADGIMVADGKGSIVLANQVFREMWGIPREIVEAKDDDAALNFVLIQIREPESFLTAVRDLYENPEKVSFDIIELKDGRIFERYSRPQRVGESVHGRVWSFRDITVRRKMEVALKESEELYRSVLNASPDAIAVTDIDGRILMVSPAGLTLFGRETHDNILGTSVTDYLAPKDRDRALANIKSKFHGASMGPNEYQAIRGDGGSVYLEVNTDLIRGNGGIATGLIIVIRDITQRKRLESDLRESEEFHRQLMSNLSMGMVIIDPVTRVIETVNDAAAAMFGASKEDIVGNRCHSFLCPAEEGRCPVCDLGKEVDNSEKILLCKDGGIRNIVKTVNVTNIGGKQKLLECFVDITAKKKDEAALKASEARFQALFEDFEDSIFVIDQATGNIIDVNPAAAKIYGFTRDEFLGLDITGIFSEPGNSQVLLEKQGQDPLPLQYHRRKDGSIFPVEMTSNTFTADGQSILISTVRDLTEKMRFHQELTDSEEKYRGLFDNMQNMVSFHRLIRDDNGEVIEATLIDANPATIRTLKITSLDEVRGKRLGEFLSRDAAKSVLANILRMVQTGKPVIDEIHSEIADGDYLTNVVPLGADGVIITGIDITERKRGERERLKSIQRFDNLASRINAGIYLMRSTPEGRLSFDYFSPKMEELFDVKKGALLADAYILFGSIHPDDLEGLEKLILEKTRLKIPFEWEGRLISQDKSVRWLRLESSPEPLENGETLFHGIAIDITEHKRMEQALRDGEEKFREISNYANDAIRVHEVFEGGIPGQFVDVNDVACRMLGYTREEMLRKRPSDISTGYYRPSFPEVLKSLNDAGWAKFETEHIHKDGTVIPVEINAHFAYLQGRKMAIAVSRDISENKRTMNALKTANEKLILLSSITRHDIKNQLMVLSGYLELLDGMQTSAESDQNLRKAQTASSHISAMIQFTKVYEDIGVNAPTWQSVRGLVDRCSGAITGQIRLVNDVPEGIEIFVDPLIVKVFHNLVDNAVKHGGKVSTVRFHVDGRGGAKSIICEDDGVGIPAGNKGYLFTKGFGKDHGLGLFLSREILAITGITISEVGEPGHGAKFKLTIPNGSLRNKPA